jgi:hypothetical protein
MNKLVTFKDRSIRLTWVSLSTNVMHEAQPPRINSGMIIFGKMLPCICMNMGHFECFRMSRGPVYKSATVSNGSTHDATRISMSRRQQQPGPHCSASSSSIQMVMAYKIIVEV